MTLRKEIAEARVKIRDNLWKDMTDDEIESIIDRIDGMGDRLCELESENIKLLLRMDSLEFASKVHTVGGTIKLGAMPEPPEPFPGYNDLIKEAIPTIREYIAEKKREMDHKVGPMTFSED